MTQCLHSEGFLRRRNRRQDKRQRQLTNLANMRAAKARKRQERIAAGLLEREPKPVRWHRFEFGVRDKATGETHFVELRSVRQVVKTLGLILKFY